MDTGKPDFLIFALETGERGKQDVPGNRGCLSQGLLLTSGNIYINSPNIHPSDHTSICWS